MRLVGANGDQVELDIAGYQFPDIADEQWDSNWLNITTTATVDHRSWTSRDPSLLTMEVEELETSVASWRGFQRVCPCQAGDRAEP